MNFDEILEDLESDGKILDFRFTHTKIPLYLFIRFSLIQSLVSKNFNLSNPSIQDNQKSIKGIVKYVYHTLRSNIFFAPKKDIYIFSSGIVNKLENGKYINRLYDEFYNIFKDKTQIIETSHNRSYFRPKKEKVFYSDIINIIIFIFSKFTNKNLKEQKNIDDFIEYIKGKNIFDEEVIKQTNKTLNKILKVEKISIFMYKLLFILKKPKIIIVEDGFYGSHFFLMDIAKKMNIKIVEYQHGYVGLKHPAYNYHKNIFETIKEYFPSFFLTHGKYWSDRIRIPAEKIEIGMPNLIKNKIFLKNSEKTILFISGGLVPDLINIFIKESFNKLNILGYKIIIRPHPSEYPAIEERYGQLIKLGVIVDKENLYETLKKVEIVVGFDVSTVLFEATCFTSKIYMMKTNFTNYYEPNSCFLSFENSEEFIKLIKNNQEIFYSDNYFWEKNWEQNYINFIKEITYEK